MIGNPPYKILTKNNTEKTLLDIYTTKYESLRNASSKNLFILFIEMVVRSIIPSPKSILCYIVPEGLFKTRSYKDCVDIMERMGQTRLTVTFTDYVFENAVTGSLIFLYQTRLKGIRPQHLIHKGYGIFESRIEEDDSLFRAMEQDSVPLSEIAHLFKGMVIRDRDRVLRTTAEGMTDRFILGKNISKWHVDSFFYTQYDKLEIIGGTKKKEKHDIFPRIVIRRTGNELCCALLDCSCITESTLYSCWPKDDRIDIYALYGILNSKLLNYYNQHENITNQQGFPQILMTDLQNLPIKIGTKEQMSKLSTIIKDIQNGKDTYDELDNLVYELYGLTQKDISIICS